MPPALTLLVPEFENSFALGKIATSRLSESPIVPQLSSYQSLDLYYYTLLRCLGALPRVQRISAARGTTENSFGAPQGRLECQRMPAGSSRGYTEPCKSRTLITLITSLGPIIGSVLRTSCGVTHTWERPVSPVISGGIPLRHEYVRHLRG